jgi:hypothetical protein
MAFDLDAVLRELGTAKFAERLASDADFRAACQAYREQQSKGVVAALPTTLWRIDPRGRDHRIERIAIGARHQMRAVGEMLIVSRHWSGRDASLCLGAGCPECGKRSKRREGYFDAVMARVGQVGREQPFRALACVPGAVVDELDGRRLRGMKFEFFRASGQAKTVTKVIEEQCAYDLPPPLADVRPILCRLWGFAEWPVNEGKEGGDENILKFRKQA